MMNTTATVDAQQDRCRKPWMQRRVQEIDRINHLRRVEPSHKTYEQATLVPVHREQGMLWGKGGVIASYGTYVKSSGLYSGAGVVTPDPANPEAYVGAVLDADLSDAAFRDESVVYLGYIQNHWGHFLVDFSTRLWFLVEHTDAKGCFIVEDGFSFEPHPNIKRFFELLGIDSGRISFVNHTTRFREVVVPEVAYCTNCTYADAYRKMFQTISTNAQGTGIVEQERVYFSRRNYSKAKRSEFGEESLEAAFAANGYAIVSPETLTLDEQIAWIRGATEVACISGTLSHNLLFAQEGKELVVLNKTPSINVVQRDVDRIARLKVTYVDSFASVCPASLGYGPFLLTRNQYLRNFFGKHGLTIPDDAYEKRSYQAKMAHDYYVHMRQSPQFGRYKYDTEWEANSYYPPEELAEFMQDYYPLAFPPTVGERAATFLSKVKSYLG